MKNRCLLNLSNRPKYLSHRNLAIRLITKTSTNNQIFRFSNSSLTLMFSKIINNSHTKPKCKNP